MSSSRFHCGQQTSSQEYLSLYLQESSEKIYEHERHCRTICRKGEHYNNYLFSRSSFNNIYILHRIRIAWFPCTVLRFEKSPIPSKECVVNLTAVIIFLGETNKQFFTLQSSFAEIREFYDVRINAHNFSESPVTACD